jgi:hypothetical protein
MTNNNKLSRPHWSRLDACPSATREGKNFNTHFWAAVVKGINTNFVEDDVFNLSKKMFLINFNNRCGYVWNLGKCRICFVFSISFISAKFLRHSYVFVCMQAGIYMKLYNVIILFIWGNLIIQRIVFLLCVFNGFYLQQIWLDQNITKKLASANKANIFYRIFEQTTVSKTNFSVSPAVSRQSFETFYPKAT